MADMISGRPPKETYKVESVTQDGEPVGTETVTVSTSAVGLTLPTNANRALIQAQGATARWRDSGTSPTASAGFRLFNTNFITLTNRKAMENFEAIREGSTNVTLEVSYYAR